ncbi:hypothetical protein, partial [Zavarzinella formosa]|uniref:hypothetical protein n=1 Tax=Zavarzinella formosa TaxID=360055 RepID=UPI00138ACDB9
MKGKSFDDILQGSPAPAREVPVAADDLGPCAARPDPAGLVSLCVINGRADSRAFQYAHLGFANFAADGTSFAVEFNEPEKWRLTVRGRKLWRGVSNLHQHR